MAMQRGEQRAQLEWALRFFIAAALILVFALQVVPEVYTLGASGEQLGNPALMLQAGFGLLILVTTATLFIGTPFAFYALYITAFVATAAFGVALIPWISALLPLGTQEVAVIAVNVALALLGVWGHWLHTRNNLHDLD